MSRPDALLLDLDDTVYAYAPRHAAALEALARRAVALGVVTVAREFVAAHDAARTDVHARLAGTAASHHRLLYVQGALERLLGHARPSTALALHDAYWVAYLEGLAPDPGAREALFELRAAGVALAFVTNLTAHIQLQKLIRLGLDELGAQVVTSEEVGHEKPHPAPFERALAKLGLDARRAWAVGDSPRADVEGARRLGLYAVHFRRGPAAAPDGPAPDAVVESWPALRDLVLRGRA